MSTEALPVNEYDILPPTFEEALKQHLPLIFWVLRGMSSILANGNIDSCEAQQLGTIGMWKAYKSFDPTKNVKWSHWARMIIRREVFGFVQDNSSVIRVPRSIHRKIKAGIRANNGLPSRILKDISEVLVGERCPTVSDSNNLDSMVLNEDVARVSRCLEMVDAKMRRIFYLRYFKEMTYKEIGDVVGTSHESVRQWCRRAMHDLKQKLTIEDQ